MSEFEHTLKMLIVMMLEQMKVPWSWSETINAKPDRNMHWQLLQN
jgi:hypothetical protein